MYGYTPNERKHLKHLSIVIIEIILRPRLEIINQVIRNSPDTSFDGYDNLIDERRVIVDLIELLKIYGEDGYVEFGF